MNRRKLLFAPIILAGLSLHKNVEAKVSSMVSLKNIFKPSEIQLGGQASYKALSNRTFVLPKNPSHGDSFKFSVDAHSLVRPCQIIAKSNHTIVGDKEPFILDMISIFSLKFNALTNNWEMA